MKLVLKRGEALSKRRGKEVHVQKGLSSFVFWGIGAFWGELKIS